MKCPRDNTNLKAIRSSKGSILICSTCQGMWIEKLKNNSETRHIPIIFCTGNLELKDIEKCFDAGGDDYTTKPIESHLVLNRIHTHLELSALRKRYREE